jgi:hypothetical protein
MGKEARRSTPRIAGHFAVAGAGNTPNNLQNPTPVNFQNDTGLNYL